MSDQFLEKVEGFFNREENASAGRPAGDTKILDELIVKLMDDRALDRMIEHFCFKRKIPLCRIIDTFEKIIIIWALGKFDNNQKRTACFLKIDASTLRRKLKKHRISVSHS